MITDTLTTIENQFFDGLKAVQDPAIEAARKAAELTAKIPVPEPAAALVAQLPSPDAIVAHNFAFAQRLLDVQRDFVTQLLAVGAETAAPAESAPRSKKSAA